MNIKKFNETYGNKGGVAHIVEMRASYSPLKNIALHYGVSSETVRIWMKQFFGSDYDPRPDRKEMIISSMIEFAKRHKDKKDFSVAFKNRIPYYDESLQRCIEEKIYDIV